MPSWHRGVEGGICERLDVPRSVGTGVFVLHSARSAEPCGMRIMMLDGALFPVRLLLVLVEDLTFERLACARLCDPRLCGLKLMFVQMQPSAPRAQRPARPARGIVYRNR